MCCNDVEMVEPGRTTGRTNNKMAEEPGACRNDQEEPPSICRALDNFVGRFKPKTFQEKIRKTLHCAIEAPLYIEVDIKVRSVQPRYESRKLKDLQS